MTSAHRAVESQTDGRTGRRTDPDTYAETAAELAVAARAAAMDLARLRGAQRDGVLCQTADALIDRRSDLLDANARDLAAAEAAGLESALRERLRLDERRIRQMADGVRQIAAQPDPIGRTYDSSVRPNGLRVEKRRVPIGVVLFCYESRPNVTADAAALCLKSGNAIILRGGKEAIHSNRAIHQVVADALVTCNLPPAAVQLVSTTDRAMLPHLLAQDRHIDLAIPRGGEGLIRAVVRDAKMPVLKHFTGNCHVYVDEHVDGMEEDVVKVCLNAKTGYPGGGVCNAAEHLLFHRDVADRLLPRVCAALAAAGVDIRGDRATRHLYPEANAATDDDWDTEYLSLILGVKVVDSLDAAADHINRHGSRHTDAILTTSLASAERFVQSIDSASVIVNASTRFADGGEYGLGAEIGISTDKLHARGPMGAEDLCTYKWVVTGAGHCR